MPAERSSLDASQASVAGHPRAARRVGQAREWSGLAGFLLTGYLSLPTHTLAIATMRALAAGIACYLLAWAAAVLLWRNLVLAEIERRERDLLEAGLARLAGDGPSGDRAPTATSHARGEREGPTGGRR